MAVLSSLISEAKPFKIDLPRPNNLEEELLEAVRNGHISEVKRLIADGVSVNVKNANMKTPLLLAALYGHANCLVALLQAGAEVGGGVKQLDRPLHLAAQLGHLECVWVLIDAGADLNGTGFLGKSALQLAVECEHGAIVDLLLEAGADPNVTDLHKCTPLHKAVVRRKSINLIEEGRESPSIDIAISLLKAGALWNEKDERGLAPFDLIQKLDNSEVLDKVKGYALSNFKRRRLGN